MRERARAAACTAILEAAEEVAAERGVDQTSIAAIAERAGVAVGTLYNYFPDRESLLASLFRHRREELVPRLDAAAREAARLPFERRLRAYLAATLGLFEEHRRFLKVAVAVDENQVKIKDRKPAVIAAIVEAVTAILRPAVGAVLAAEYAQIVVGAMRGLAHWRVVRGEPLTDDVDLLVDTLLKGIAR
ncbi:MAG TPA: TetR/AcrR family transcriptional regulator [Kofleriaceae bacterium]|nr:TetR/AcrR family transcriptional regulator [Kofleriaceae bacterium]